jgi:transmembrane sensor
MQPSEAGELARKAVAPPWDELRAARVQKRVLAGLKVEPEPEHQVPAVETARRRSRLYAWGLALAAAAALILFVLLRTGATTLELADGSVATLDDGARVVPELVSDDRVELRQVSGSASYDVVPRPSRTFVVLVDDVRVEVLGTSFRVERLDDSGDVAVRVAVTRGRVKVTRGARTAVLTAGEELTWKGEPLSVPTPETTAAAVVTPTAAPGAAPGVSTSEPVTVPSTPTVEEPSPTSPSAASARPSAAPKPEPLTAAELFRQADDARASGNDAVALKLLQSLLELHPKDSRVTMARFTMGRIEARRGNVQAAARAFEACGAGLSGEALAEAALLRAGAGESAAATELARRYLELYPLGARAKEMARLAP